MKEDYLMKLLSPKIIFFNSMKNLIYVMKDLRMPNKLKVSVFNVVEKFGS